MIQNVGNKLNGSGAQLVSNRCHNEIMVELHSRFVNWSDAICPGRLAGWLCGWLTGCVSLNTIIVVIVMMIIVKGEKDSELIMQFMCVKHVTPLLCADACLLTC